MLKNKISFIVILILIITITGIVVGCGGNDAETTSTPTETPINANGEANSEFGFDATELQSIAGALGLNPDIVTSTMLAVRDSDSNSTYDDKVAVWAKSLDVSGDDLTEAIAMFSKPDEEDMALQQFQAYPHSRH